MPTAKSPQITHTGLAPVLSITIPQKTRLTTSVPAAKLSNKPADPVEKPASMAARTRKGLSVPTAVAAKSPTPASK